MYKEPKTTQKKQKKKQQKWNEKSAAALDFGNDETGGGREAELG